MSKFIAIEGLDGAGKSTQIKLLIDYLKASGTKIKFIHFPRSGEGIFGDLIAKFLRGEFGEIENVHPQLVALLFAEDRKDFASTIINWLAEGYFVLADRYVLSNIAYQCAKLKNENEKSELAKWIMDFEFEYNKIPKPDLSIYLDVPVSFITKSLSEKRDGEGRDYLNGKDDIHEKDLSFQLLVKAEYDKIVDAYKSIKIINCADEKNQMADSFNIHKQIIEVVINQLQKK